MSRRLIGAVTGSRADYGILRPVLRKIDMDPDLDLHLTVTGMHLSPDYGSTVKDIEGDGFRVADRIDVDLTSDDPHGISRSIGLGVAGYAESFSRLKPDILLVLGDRYEMLAAAVAAMPFMIPLAHIHGGEATEGLIDEAIRHSLTKMSHLHFVATEEYGKRVVQMGEEPWRVTVTGAPGLDNLMGLDLLSGEELGKLVGLPMDPPPLLVTFHPVTLQSNDTERHISALLEALDEVGMPVIFTYPNADTYGQRIINAINSFVKDRQWATAARNLGTRAYFSLMARVSAMVGNSSSGIIEAASFRLPVVDVGKRQQGRIRAGNVIHCPCDSDAIVEAVRVATGAAFKKAIADLENPYGDGHASQRIVAALKTAGLDDQLLVKRFHDSG